MLYTGRPQDAVRQLEQLPIDTHMPLMLTALVTRAESFRQLGRLEDAERDFRATLDFRSPAVLNLSYPLARIGLARTLAASGNAGAARDEYDKILEQWKDADDDVRLVREVRAEAAKLGS